MDIFKHIFKHIMGNISINDSLITSVLIGLLSFWFNVFLISNTEEINKSYQKKVILAIYFYFILCVSLNLKICTLEMFFTQSIILFLFLFLSTVNFYYNADKLEKELSIIPLGIFSFFKMFFYIKAYIFYMFLIVLFFFNTLFSINFLQYLIVLIFMSYHLLSNAKDYFEVYSFEEVKAELNIVDEIKNINKIDTTNFNVITYFEDKDYFKNKLFITNIVLILRRKLTENANSESSNIKNEVKEKFYITRYWRGYSTIEMQLIPQVSSYSDTYDVYPWRRKFFSEFIYIPFFFSALFKQQARYGRQLSLIEKKNIILNIYIKQIYKISDARDINILLIKLSEQSKKELDLDHYKREYKKEFE